MPICFLLESMYERNACNLLLLLCSVNTGYVVCVFSETFQDCLMNLLPVNELYAIHELPQ